jgi:hypothetical protein
MKQKQKFFQKKKSFLSFIQLHPKGTLKIKNTLYIHTHQWKYMVFKEIRDKRSDR